MTPVETIEVESSQTIREDRLRELCGLLARASGAPLKLVKRGSATTESPRVPLVDGWSLSGGASESRLTASAELMRTLGDAEREIASLSGEIVDRYEEATLIYRLTERLGSVLGEDAICRLVLSEVATVLRARAAEIWLCEDEAMVRAAAIPAEGPPAAGPPEAELAIAIGEMRPVIREERPGRETRISVPLPAPGGDAIGVILLHGRTDGRSYRTGEVKLLTALASLASAFLHNDRLANRSRREEARRREDEIARQIHRGLLPAGEPAFAGLEVAGLCRAAENIGGDYYGYIEMIDGSLGVAMADVSGHGVGAALYMAAAKGAFQAEARRAHSPAEMLTRTNQALLDDFSRSDVFATAFFARIHPGARRLDYSNGGHNPPLLVRREGQVERLVGGGAALGVVPGMSYSEQSRELAEGDVVLLYTDGLIEARDPSREFYGSDRMLEMLVEHRGLSAASIRDRLMDDLMRHCGSSQPQDDVTLVVLRAGEIDADIEAEDRR